MIYSKEQIDAADSISIFDIFARNGEVVVRSGSEYYLKKNDSLYFKGNVWYRHSTGEGGRAIELCKKFYGMAFPDAMNYLLFTFRPELLEEGNSECIPMPDNKKTDEQQTNAKCRLCPPVPSMTNEYAMDYLVNKRCLSKDIVSFFIGEGTIYEDCSTRGVVFVGTDEYGKGYNYHLRNALYKSRNEKHTFKGSDMSYGFGYRGCGCCLYVFEAPIDLLSFICLYPKDWKQNSYVALNGLSPKPIFRRLSESEDIKSIVLCLDNDDAGNSACKRITENLREEGYTHVSRLLSVRKDWNEDLVAIVHARVELQNSIITKGEGLCSLL